MCKFPIIDVLFNGDGAGWAPSRVGTLPPLLCEDLGVPVNTGNPKAAASWRRRGLLSGSAGSRNLRLRP